MAQQVDLTTVTYVALRDMKIGGSTRTKGSAVPEAASWPNLSTWIASGYIGTTQATTVGKPSHLLHTKVGKAEGNAEYTHYRPVDYQGVPAKISTDAT